MLDWSWLIKLSLLCVRCMYGCSNCFGGFAKSQRLDSSGNLLKQSKDSRRPDQSEATPLNKPSDTSSSDEMENNGSTSRQPRTSSSISANNHIQETRSTNDIDANSSYVNHALILWTERRREWVGTRERPQPAQHREPVISWSTTYEDLLATSRPFPQPIPLPSLCTIDELGSGPTGSSSSQKADLRKPTTSATICTLFVIGIWVFGLALCKGGTARFDTVDARVSLPASTS